MVTGKRKYVGKRKDGRKRKDARKITDAKQRGSPREICAELLQDTLQGGVAREGRRKGQRCKRKRLEETVAMNAFIIFCICCTILVAGDVLLTFNTLFRVACMFSQQFSPSASTRLELFRF